MVCESGLADESFSFRTMTWNIWHGGREDGEKIGPKRVRQSFPLARSLGAVVRLLPSRFSSQKSMKGSETFSLSYFLSFSLKIHSKLKFYHLINGGSPGDPRGPCILKNRDFEAKMSSTKAAREIDKFLKIESEGVHTHHPS